MLAIGFSGRAQDYVIASGLAIHLDGKDHCNSTTTGLGIEHEGYAVGFFRNSNCRWSTYAAKFWTPFHLQVSDWRLKLGALAGVVTGYPTSPMPAGGFVASLEFGHQKINVVYIPPVGSTGNVIWLQSGFRW